MGFDSTWEKFMQDSPFMAWYMLFALAHQLIVEAIILALAKIVFKEEWS